ncbi:MAG: outer membrane lipoprotein-sorting protein [Deltaproteobacteria bacterium]|nr:outer membrane lipoprotein-sorting protein [Deltaproteobacteria bacterium]
MTRRLVCCILPLASFWLAGLAALSPARAESPDAVLQKMDDAINRYKTLHVQYDIVNQEPGRPQSTFKVESWLEGDKQVTELQAPADVRGTKVLQLSETQMYIYLPAFRKIRRIASHFSEQGFLGTAFSQVDIAHRRYANFYTAKLVSDDGAAVTLELAPKSAEAPYPKMQIAIEKQRSVPTVLRYYGGSGAHIKTEERAGYFCEQGFCTAKSMKMTDHSKGGHWSELRLTKHEINVAIPEGTFSKRSLQH